MAVGNRERKRQADALYERYGRPLEATHRGAYVAISPSGQTVLAPTALEAADKALEAFGPGSFLFKIGEKAVWRWR
jgi:hypothetical protein